jgi:SAM-dependent methyltransferase
MAFYDDHVLPHLIDIVCSAKPTRKQREKIVHLAEGDVLEIGFGIPGRSARSSASNHRQGCDAKQEVTSTHQDWTSSSSTCPVRKSRSSRIASTAYTLCTIPDAVAALQGMRRVLRPGGRLLFCEHGEAPDANVRRWQHRLNPGWRRVAGGCNMNRDIPGLIEKSGFRITSDEHNYWGIAKP